MDSSPPPPPLELLRRILDDLLPLLLLSSLSPTSVHSRWRLLHPKLTRLHSILSDASIGPHHHPLFVQLLPSLSFTLTSLLSLSDPSALSRGKLLLQSDLDIASSSLSISIHDLEFLLKSGLLHRHHRQSEDNDAAIVLPVPGPSSSKSDVVLFVKDAFARIQIGGLDLKHKALDSLRQLLLSDPAKTSLLIAKEGDVAALVRLLDPMNHSMIRDQAAAVAAVLVTASDLSRKAVFEEGALGPLLRLLEAGSASVKEHAATAVEAITADPSNAWAVLAYGGVGVLVAACRSGGGPPVVRALAAGSLKNVAANVAAVEDLRAQMIEEGAVAVLIDLLVSGTDPARKNASICLRSLASEGDEEVKTAIFQEGGLMNLMRLVQESSDPEILEHGLRAIQTMTSYIPAARAVSSSRAFFLQLTELIRIGNVAIQQIAAGLISSPSPNEEIKGSMAGCMPALIKMMELPKPVSAQEVAADALVCLLAVRLNRIELGRDVKSMTKIVQMLDPKQEEISKKFPMSVVVALAASGGCRKRLSELGACQQLQKLVDCDVAGAKRALKMITGSRIRNLLSLSWRE